MHQAVAAAIEWAFRQDRIDRVQAFARIDNLRSQRLLERSGFLHEGCLRAYRVCHGEAFDFHVYGLLRRDRAAARTPSGASAA